MLKFKKYKSKKLTRCVGGGGFIVLSIKLLLPAGTKAGYCCREYSPVSPIVVRSWFGASVVVGGNVVVVVGACVVGGVVGALVAAAVVAGGVVAGGVVVAV